MERIEDAVGIEQVLIAQAAQQQAPINGSFELTPLCNMDCRMCYVRLSPAELAKQGRLRTPEEWLSLGKQMQEMGVLYLLLTGGEPLTYPGFKEVYLGLRKLGMILTINTNGTLLNEEWADFFAKYKPRRINITLYGTDAETYANLCGHADGFARMTKAVRLLRERNVPVKINVSLTPDNADQIMRMCDMAQEMDAPVQVDTYMVPAERERTRPFNQQSRVNPVEAARIRMQVMRRQYGEEGFAQFAKQKLYEVEEAPECAPEPCGLTCLAGSCSFTVNWQGEMRPCVILSTPSMPVFELGFAESWKRIREDVAKMHTCGTCTACRMKPLCRTCAACALMETGDMEGVSPYMCAYAEESIRILREYRDAQNQA